jgi:ribosomal protein S6--L-glutamate ligase
MLNIAILTADPANYSNKRMISAGKGLGHNVYTLLTHEQVIPSHDHIYLSELDRTPDAVIPRIGVSLSDFGQKLINIFENANIPTTVSSYGFINSRDKFLAGQLLSRCGLAIPKTTLFTNIDKLNDAIESIGGYPFIFKAVKGTQGDTVFLINDINTAKKIISEYINERRPFLIQEFISDSEGSDIRCFVIEKEVVAAMKRTAKFGDFRSNIHAGGLGSMTEITHEERKMAIDAANFLNLPIAGVDILRSNNGPKLLEVNSSPGLEEIERVTSINIAYKIIKLVEKMVYKNE